MIVLYTGKVGSKAGVYTRLRLLRLCGARRSVVLILQALLLQFCSQAVYALPNPHFNLHVTET